MRFPFCFKQSGEMNDMKESTSRLNAVSLIGLIWLVAATTGSSEVPLGLEPDCAQWDVRGQWEFVQTNGASPVFTFEQTETGVLGSAKYGFYKPVICDLVDCKDDYYLVHASVDGTAKGNSFDVVAYWDNGTTGVYTGKIGPQGRIEGSTYDKQHPQTMASWYSNRTATCLTQIGTSASPLTTAPASQTVRAIGRVRLGGTTTKSTLTKCEAAKLARARNSPAAPGLEASCAAEKASGVSDVATAGNEVRRAPPGESPVVTKEGKFGGGATRIALLATQPENSIQVRVRYRKEFGFKDTTNAFGPVGPTSCSAFSISLSEPNGSRRRMRPLPISGDSRMADVGDYYVCSYLISDFPLDQSIVVTARVSGADESGPWNGGDAAQPPTGERRAILEASRTATLNSAMPRARLSYEMVYAPLPRIR